MPSTCMKWPASKCDWFQREEDAQAPLKHYTDIHHSECVGDCVICVAHFCMQVNVSMVT